MKRRAKVKERRKANVKRRVIVVAKNSSHNLAFTTQKAQTFLQALIDTGSPTHASRAAGITRRTAYNWRERYSEFAAEWDAAHAEGVDELEREARRRAMGYDEKVVTKEGRVITVRKHSDLLLITLLNANRPEKFRPPRGEIAPPLSPEDAKRVAEARDVLKRLSTDELSTIATVMEKATTRAVAQAVGQPKRTLQ